MLGRFAEKLSFSNAAAAVALFLAVSGGTAIALKGKNKVFSDDIKNGAVKKVDLAPGAGSQGFYATKRAQQPLPPASADLNVVSLSSLPAGAYMLSGHTTVRNFTDNGIIRCGIRAAGKDSADSPTGFAFATAIGPDAGRSQVAQIPASLAVNSQSAFSAQLYCRETNGSVSGITEESRLQAIRVGKVTITGDP